MFSQLWRFFAVRAAFWAILVALPVGVASAFFLWSLDFVTKLRFQNPNLLFLLPFAGVLLALVYEKWGQNAARGTDAILSGIETENGREIPFRMAPLILFSTLWTHLFGGSAGREGTALQLGGALAATLARVFRAPESDVRAILLFGVAAGFGGVFGTPFAGAIFAFEAVFGARPKRDFLGGKRAWPLIFPCLACGALANFVAHFCGAHHANWRLSLSTNALFDAAIWLQLALVGAVFGAAAWSFVVCLGAFRQTMNRAVKSAIWRPFWGGILVVALVFALGTRDYLGLGAWSPSADSVSIESAFKDDGAEVFSWFWKGVFTILTLGSGFKGGEVTPLFFIGATLGNALGAGLGAPEALFAAAGLVGVFAGATKTPIACAVLGIELFGAPFAPVFVGVCALATLCSGRVSIYDVAYLRAATQRSEN